MPRGAEPRGAVRDFKTPDFFAGATVDVWVSLYASSARSAFGSLGLALMGQRVFR